MTEAWNLTNGTVEVFVNGESKGTVPSSSNLGETVKRFARASGIKSVVVYLDGNELPQGGASDPIGQGEELEISSYDSQAG